MVYEIYKTQFDGCTYVSGGQNCTPTSEAMWLWRASQGKINVTPCTVRRLTGDTVGGTNLEQMQQVSFHYGIGGGALWRPGSFDRLRDLILTGRYGAHVQVGYSVIAGTVWDCFSGQFRGGHDVYVSRGNANTVHEGDPGANGRRPGIPKGYQDMPWSLLERAAGALPLKPGLTLGQEQGPGHVYAYLTPADPIIPTQKWLISIDGTTADPDVATTLYAAPNGAKVGGITKATYVCLRSKVAGLWWFQIRTKADGSATNRAGRWFKPNRYITGGMI